MDPITTPVETKRPGGGKNLVIAVVVILLLIGGYFGYKSFKGPKPTPTPPPIVEQATPTPTEEATPSATPKATTTPKALPTHGVVSNVHDLDIQILNGSGTAGAAGGVKDFLAGKGYKNLETGNADNFDYQNVTVRIKDSASKFLNEINNDLKEKYTIASQSGTLSADALFDVSIIVGK